MTTSININALASWTSRLHDFIGQCQALPPGQLSDWHLKSETRFEELALELYSLQTRLNPAYAAWTRDRCPAPLLSWKEIPAMPAAGFKELDLSCIPSNQRSTVFHSSGTTGHSSSRHFHNDQSLKSYELSLLTWFEKKLIPTGNQPHLILLTPTPDQAPHSSLVHMFSAVSQKFSSIPDSFVGQCEPSSGRWTIDVTKILCLLEEASRQSQPVYLLGTAFNFVHLLDHLAANQVKFQLPPLSAVMETGGYKNQSRSVPKNALRASLSDCLGIPTSRIVGEYGMSELSSQAYDSSMANDSVADPEVTGLFCFPPWARAMAICPEQGAPLPDGQPGLLRVVDLANVWSVLAVQTEDLAVIHEQSFDLMGRSQDAEPRGCSLQTA